MHPSPPILTRQQVREVDRIAIEELKMPGLVLMENAGRGVADGLHGQFGVARAWIVCGPGNNGGDGFVIARHLDVRGWQVTVLLTTPSSQLKGDALANFQWLAASGVTFEQITDDYDWPRMMPPGDGTGPWYVVDAILGTGATGPLRPSVASICRQLNQLPATRVAIDIPTGLDAETGRADDDTFMAHHTYTFVAAKPGLCMPNTKKYVGELEILPIGVPTGILRRFGL